jgi:hypothetical protein
MLSGAIFSIFNPDSLFGMVIILLSLIFVALPCLASSVREQNRKGLTGLCSEGYERTTGMKVQVRLSEEAS